jgi:hypothetical protein
MDRLGQRRVATARHHDVGVAVKAAVAPGTLRHAASGKAIRTRHVERLERSARRHDHLPRPPRPVGPAHGLGRASLDLVDARRHQRDAKLRVPAEHAGRQLRAAH